MQVFSVLLLASAALAIPAPLVNVDRHVSTTRSHHTRAHTDHTVHATPTATPTPVANAQVPEADATNFVKHAGMKIGIPQITGAPAV